MLTQAYLKSVLHYDPFTGIFTWIKSNRDGWTGKQAGTIYRNPSSKVIYRYILICKKKYLAHRLAWLYIYDSIPEFLDHKDENGLNNALSNLRSATIFQNACNTKLTKSNTSGVKGVQWYKREQRWVATVKYLGRQHYGGYFVDIVSATKAVRVLREKLHGAFVNHG